jgi:hypothetical protein
MSFGDPFGTRYSGTSAHFRIALATAAMTTTVALVDSDRYARIKVDPAAGETPAERGARLAADRRRALQGPKRGRY